MRKTRSRRRGGKTQKKSREKTPAVRFTRRTVHHDVVCSPISIRHNTDIEKWRETFDNGRPVIPPSEIERIGIFIYFLKQLFMEAPVRAHFMKKFNANYKYYLYRIDFDDKKRDAKIQEITNIYNEHIRTNCSFVIDIAEGLESGGHWTSIRYSQGKAYFMDSDPLSYGTEGKDLNKRLHDWTKNMNLPPEMYGNNVYRQHSIQALDTSDTFCQSWSLLYFTLAETNPQMFALLKYKQNERPKEKYSNFYNEFINNFMTLIGLWKQMMGNDSTYDALIENTQWKNWNSKSVCERLDDVAARVTTDISKMSIEKFDEAVFCHTDLDAPEEESFDKTKYLEENPLYPTRTRHTKRTK